MKILFLILYTISFFNIKFLLVLDLLHKRVRDDATHREFYGVEHVNITFGKQN